MSNAVAKVDLRTGGKIAAIIPESADQLFRLAQMIAVSGLAPKGMDRPEQITAAIAHGLEIGLAPMQAVQSIAVVNGRPTVWGDAALGLVRGSGLMEDFEEVMEGSGEAMRAVCRAKRAGQASEIVRTFSIADARAAGLWGKQGPWRQYPKRMLQLRARAFCLRDGFADVLKGLQVTEEVRDYHGPSVPAAGDAPRPKAVTAAELLGKPDPELPPQDAEFEEAVPVDHADGTPEEDAVPRWQRLLDEAEEVETTSYEAWDAEMMEEIKAHSQTDKALWGRLNKCRNDVIARLGTM